MHIRLARGIYCNRDDIGLACFCL